MTQMKHRAPNPEWVQMYQRGIPSAKIAAEAGVAVSTVRYHLRMAAQAVPSIRDEHKASAGSVIRNTPAGVRNMNDTVALYKAEGRLPSTGAASARERALGVWLYRRRQDYAQGTLSALYREGLSVIPGWNNPSTRKVEDEARWHRRLAEVRQYMGRGNDWPRHKKADTEEERILGVWLHVQRIKHRNHGLDHNKEARLNAALPGWRWGRAPGRLRRL